MNKREQTITLAANSALSWIQNQIEELMERDDVDLTEAFKMLEEISDYCLTIKKAVFTIR